MTGRTEIVKLRVKDLAPYINNPRFNDEAVADVRKSLEEFGYVQRIVVDCNNVIVAGHTRWKAMMEMGWDDKVIEVVRYDDIAKNVRAYRLVDNKSGERAKWDYDKLDEEIAELDKEGLDMSDFGFVEVEDLDLDGFFVDADGTPKDAPQEEERQKCTCPYCGREFEL